ncbi:DUF368 domain-containing protein [Ekhidna sp.]|uniref:DUF368 domain-containing protein n=1 Tax=Ekhidna sp. TaxID=2608089 RepID=UPI00329727EA
MKNLILFLKGVAMGAANVIPGVSGGTVAFITGIYERLINALKNIDLEAVKLLFSGSFRDFALKIDLSFLVILFLGVFVSILSLAKVLEIAFEQYEILTLSFFFGLIIASVIAVSRQIQSVSITVVISFIVGAAIAIGIAFLPPAQPNDSFIYLTLCGVVAVCSMILPGLSGSYILLLMGNYVLVLKAISSLDVNVLIPVALGCFVGLILLSRLLAYLFRKFKDATIAVLSGFVAGSLLIIWPWKATIMEEFAGKEKAVGYIWEMPQIDLQFAYSIFLIVIGFLLVYWMERKSLKPE